MKLIICQRENLHNETVFIPIMEADKDGEPKDTMAQFEDDEVDEFCANHPLASASLNHIVDTETGETSTR